MKKSFSNLVLVVLVSLPLSAVARDKTPAPDEKVLPAAKKEPVKAVTSPNAKSSILWNSWYTMTVGGKIPFGYYNDRVERKDGKFAYQNQLWKKEEGFVNEERVVSFGQDDEKITPLLFNFRATYRNTELSIDGTFSGSSLSVKARKNKEALPSIQTTIPSKAFLSTLFQVWIGKHLGGMKTGKSVSFTTLFEDGLDNRYSPVFGSATLQAPDEITKKTGSQKLQVELADMKSTWYVLPTGEAVRIEKPDQHLVIEKKTEPEARRFLTTRSDTGSVTGSVTE